MPLDNEQIRDRLRVYAGEFVTLLKSGAPRESLLNGDGRLHGLNHLNELLQMLPNTRTSEFQIRE